MAATKSNKKKQKKTKPHNLTKKIIIWAIILFTAAGCVWVFSGGGMHLFVPQKMTHYLNTRYGKEFRVYNLIHQSAGLDEPNIVESYSAKAKPKDNSTKEFEVTYAGDRYYSDNYMDAVWSRQAEQSSEMRPLKGRFFGSSSVGPEINVYYQKSYAPKKSELDPKNIINYKDLIEKYPKGIAQHITITQTLSGDLPMPIEVFQQEAISIVNYLNSLGYFRVSARFIVNYSLGKMECNAEGSGNAPGSLSIDQNSCFMRDYERLKKNVR